MQAIDLIVGIVYQHTRRPYNLYRVDKIEHVGPDRMVVSYVQLTSTHTTRNRHFETSTMPASNWDLTEYLYEINEEPMLAEVLSEGT